MYDSLRPHGLQHARLPCPSPTPTPIDMSLCTHVNSLFTHVYWVYLLMSICHEFVNSCLLSWWCHPSISSSVVPFSSHLQSSPASESLQMSQFFTSGGQSVGVSASASVLPMNIQDWSPLGWTGWISLQSKGLPRIVSNSTVHKHQFFSTKPSLQSNSHIHAWLLEKP